ncbi:MAG: hypothetical protein GOVbin3264_35 [Prokaryotic dsDNA virus sp.]|nr:MAG: hypothetical protein GOVbin3264_35 [Prokaryotic dsDNA virus sp.]|tara:strand:- start:648 stop:1301 length:654 start_codon:yes stop_codon:yes gene_type:complete
MKHLLSSTAFLVVNKRLAKRVGLKAAVLLADLISKEQYFIERKELTEGYFYNTERNIYKDTTLSPYQQRKALRILKKENLITTKRKGVPAKMHYKINEELVVKFLNDLSESKLPTLNNIKEIKKSLSIRAQEFQEQVYMSNLSTELCQEFIDYWTETNKSNTKMKFEMQKTFDIKRRLARWVKNNEKWSRTKTSKIDKQLDNHNKAINIIKNNYGSE